jgi:hypothetical protein
MAKTVKEAKADIFLRDTDSQSLFNNSGVLSFKYYHEWNDCYNQVTGETAQIAGEVYDETTNSYKPNCPEGFSPVFNGRLSALWDNIVNCFPNEVEAMYKSMRGNGLTYQDMLTKYKDFWKYWCENLYNADAFGYANTNNFTKAYGDKVQVMDYFFGKRQRYLDSKYHCGSSVGNNLRLRLYEVGRGFAIKHYQAIYCTLQWGVGNFDDHRNIKPGTYSYMPFKFSNPQDATFDVDDADLITELSTYVKGSNGNYNIYGLEGLGDFKFDLNMSLLKRLTKFVMNYTASKPNTKEAGTSFDLSNMGMLRQVIVRNVKNLEKSIILSSDLLEEIDFTNTPITGVTTPPTDMLTKLVLPDTIAELHLKGYSNLSANGMTIGSYANIKYLDFEDCPNLDSYAICKACFDANSPLVEATVKGVNWSVDDMKFLMWLADKGVKLQGKIVCTANVTMDQKRKMLNAWGKIDNEGNSLYISYEKVAIKSVSIIGKKNFGTKGDYSLTLRTLPSTGNNFTSERWSISENSFATIEKDTGVIHVNKVGSKENDDKATVYLEVELSDGSTLNAESEIYFYPYQAQLGDYVFSDGTYGGDLSFSDATPIAVIFYIEPKERKWAIAVALNDYGLRVWGLYNSTDANFGMNGIKLGSNPIYNVYNLPLLQEYTNIVNVSDSTMRDESNTANDGFKEYLALNSISDIGFEKITQSMWDTSVGHTTLSEYFDRVGLKVGDMVARGQLNTLKIIAHRDYILKDTNVNLPIPKATSDKTLAQSLSECIKSVQASHNNAEKYQQYYYPAASYCNAYIPSLDNNTQTLAEQFSEGHWFLMSSGEMARCSWYARKGYDDASTPHAIFAKPWADLRFNKFSNTEYLLSSEYSETNSWLLNPVTGGYNFFAYNKGYPRLARAAVAFKL